MPPVSLTTKDCVSLDASVYIPPAPQLPGELQSIALTRPRLPTLSAPDPGTSWALPQVPCVSSTTKACVPFAVSPYVPMALQFPAEAHEIALIAPLPPVLSVAAPGTSTAPLQVPPACASGTATSPLASAAALKAPIPTMRRKRPWLDPSRERSDQRNEVFCQVLKEVLARSNLLIAKTLNRCADAHLRCTLTQN